MRERAIRDFIQKNALFMVIAIVTAASFPSVKDSIKRMYATNFLGLDVAGESLKELTGPEERIFLRTHPQGCGLARYARRYMGWTEDAGDFKRQEERFNIRYICFYPGEYAVKTKQEDPELFSYIAKNYHVKEVGLMDEPSRVVYIILERGKGSDPDTFLMNFSGPRKIRNIYKLFGNYLFFYTIRPEETPPRTEPPEDREAEIRQNDP